MKMLAALAFAAIVPTPEGWRSESFQFPLVFAPSIPFEGEEQVRFAPGWSQFASENGFSYFFLWSVKSKPVTSEDIEDHLEAYFDGLMKNVAIARKLEMEAPKTAAAVHPMMPVAGWTQAYGVELRTWNAFAKGERLLLNGEISQRDCGGGRMQVFFAFAMAKRDQKTWDALRRARAATTCTPATPEKQASP